MTKLATLIHMIGLTVHNLFSHKITAEDIKSVAEEAAAVANIYTEVKKETAGITDPAKLSKALAVSIVGHAHELPAEMQNNLEASLVKICQDISGLPLEEIESIIKAELAAK